MPRGIVTTFNIHKHKNSHNGNIALNFRPLALLGCLRPVFEAHRLGCLKRVEWNMRATKSLEKRKYECEKTAEIERNIRVEDPKIIVVKD